MGKTIRRADGDTDPLIYIIRDKAVGEDITKPVDLKDLLVYFTMVDSNMEEPKVYENHIFHSVDERDAYFESSPTELIDGLVIDVQTINIDATISHCYLRYRDDKWNTDFWVVIDDKECKLIDDSKGYVTYSFTTEECRRTGMYHVYFRVVTDAEDPEDPDDPTETIKSVKYPRGDTLWIHIMDVFSE